MQLFRRTDVPIFAYLLVKLAARCNLNCSYCYWFRDESVYRKPIVLSPEAEVAFCAKLQSHVKKYRLDEFTLLFHGGEPLLFGKERFITLLQRLEQIKGATGCDLTYMITTNGVLVDREWASIFHRFNVHVSVSIDGPQEIHDRRRRDFAERGSHAKAVRAIHILRDSGLQPGAIAVCDPETDPTMVVSHIVDELGIRNFDILPPDATHDDFPRSIAAYYKQLFDYWYEVVGPRGVEIRIISGILQGLFTGQVVTDSIGFAPVHTVTLLTDGSLESLDVLRISRAGVNKTQINIFDHELQDVMADENWRSIYDASLFLPAACLKCSYHQACGGGHLAHRWSKLKGFDNPSVYCEDWKAILAHVWRKLGSRIAIVHRNGEIPLSSVPVDLPAYSQAMSATL